MNEIDVSGRKRHFKSILTKLNSLKPLPMVASQILKALDDPEVSTQKLINLVSQDMAVSAHILRIANSAYMGYAKNCTSIVDGVMRVGYKRIRTVVMGAVAAGPLSRRLSGYRMEDSELWNHSMSTAQIAHWLSNVLNYAEPEVAYVAGLLHDMGKVIMDQHVGLHYRELTSISDKLKIELWDAEEKFFGIDHATIGGYMASEWKFPPKLVNAIRSHHVPAFAETDQDLASIINISNAFSKGRVGMTLINPMSLRYLSLGFEDIDRFYSSKERLKIGDEIGLEQVGSEQSGFAFV